MTFTRHRTEGSHTSLYSSMASTPTATAQAQRACDRYVSSVHIHMPHHSHHQLVAVTEGRSGALSKARPLAKNASLLVLHVHTMRSHRRKDPKAVAPKSCLNFAKHNAIPNLLLDSHLISASMAGRYPRHLLARRALRRPLSLRVA